MEISQGMVHVRNFSNESLLFSHSVKQIHKCVMEQADHTHFLYTLKPSQVSNNTPNATLLVVRHIPELAFIHFFPLTL